MAGPTPLTRSKLSREPKGPRESRSAIIRFASAGPIRGRRRSDSAGAVSRSKGIEGVALLEGGGARLRSFALDPLDPFDALDALAESTAAICASSAARALAGGPSSPRDAR